MITSLQNRYIRKVTERWGQVLSERNRRVLINVSLSFLFKGISILLALAVVPLSISYLDAERYGVWITLSSMLSWINLMDIGLGNGLRNKLVKALSDGDQESGRRLVSTTYALVAGIAFLVGLVFVLIVPSFDLNKVFNTNTISQSELLACVTVSFISFCLLFVLKPLTAVIMATQNASLDNLLILIGNLLSIIGIVGLNYVRAGHGTMLEMVAVFSVAPLVAYLLGSIYLYRRFANLRPSIHTIDQSQIGQLAGTSLKFFIIQIAAAVVMTSNSVILSQLFGNEKVTEYNVAFRYFSVVTVIQTIILTPIWSAVTEAYVKKDFLWIKSITNKLFINSVLLGMVIVIQSLVAPTVFRMWLGNHVTVEVSLLVAVAIHTVLVTFSSAFSYVINGVGVIRLSTLTAICTCVFSIPTAIYLGQQLGPMGVILANCIWLALFLPLRVIQYRKIVSNTTKGIWSK